MRKDTFNGPLTILAFNWCFYSLIFLVAASVRSFVFLLCDCLLVYCFCVLEFDSLWDVGFFLPLFLTMSCLLTTDGVAQKGASLLRSAACREAGGAGPGLAAY